MADWPEVDELQQVLDLPDPDDNWSTTLDRVLASAIARVKRDVGDWDEMVDEPDDSLAQAALRMAELIATRPTEPIPSLAKDPAYETLLFGKRRVFGVA